MNQETKPLTRQQLFDNALMGIRAQGHRQSSPDGLTCVYISENGDRCAVGHSLPASITREMLEAKHKNSGTGPVALRLAFPEIASVIDPADEDFLGRLQRIHDSRELANGDHEAFERQMHNLADGYKLNYTPRRAIAA